MQTLTAALIVVANLNLLNRRSPLCGHIMASSGMVWILVGGVLIGCLLLYGLYSLCRHPKVDPQDKLRVDASECGRLSPVVQIGLAVSGSPSGDGPNRGVRSNHQCVGSTYGGRLCKWRSMANTPTTSLELGKISRTSTRLAFAPSGYTGYQHTPRNRSLEPLDMNYDVDGAGELYRPILTFQI